MSHKSGGFFYYQYVYQCPAKDAYGNVYTDSTHTSAVYSPAKRQDHEAQSNWAKNVAFPAIEAEVKRVFYPVIKNKKGHKYEPYSQRYVRELDFRWYPHVPTHTDGPLKGQSYGHQV